MQTIGFFLQERDMNDEKPGSERLGTPDTGAHDKKHGDKLKSPGKPVKPGTGEAAEDWKDAEVPDDPTGGGV